MSDVFSPFNSDDVYDILRNEIMTLTIEPGSLLSENSVSARFGTSRTPVRAAFERLRNEGLIQVIPKKGTFVSLIDLDLAEQILYMRINVEVAAFTELSKKSCPDLLNLLEKNVEEQRLAVENGVIRDNFYLLDSRFHGLCLEAVGRQKLWNMIDHMDAHYSRYRHMDFLISNQELIFPYLYKQHRELMNAIASHRTYAMKNMITTHMYGGLLRNGDRLSKEYGHYFEKNGRTVDQILVGMKMLIQSSKEEMLDFEKKGLF